MYTCLHTHIYTRTRTHAKTHNHTYLCTHACTHVSTHARTHAQHTYTQVHTHIHTHINTYTHIRTSTHTQHAHTYTYTHTHMCVRVSAIITPFITFVNLYSYMDCLPHLAQLWASLITSMEKGNNQKRLLRLSPRVTHAISLDRSRNIVLMHSYPRIRFLPYFCMMKRSAVCRRLLSFNGTRCLCLRFELIVSDVIKMSLTAVAVD